ncbi:hypothetical protein Tco_0421007 [Tanacetum coccineum]
MCKTFVANNTSGLVLKRQKASDYDNSDLAPQLQNVSPSADITASSQQELDLLFGPLYDVFFNAGTSSVNKSSSPTKNSKQQDTPPIMNIQSSTEPITPTNVNVEENNDNQAEDTQFQQDEFINPFYTRTAELKNIKEAMADSAWIEAMQEELHQFDRLQVWELVDKPFGKTVIKLKVILLSIHSDEWKSFQSQHQTDLRFQDDAKYEHVGQDTRSQSGKDDHDKQGKDLKISEQKTKSKDNDKGSRSKITQHEGTSLQHNKDQRFKNSMTKQS